MVVRQNFYFGALSFFYTPVGVASARRDIPADRQALPLAERKDIDVAFPLRLVEGRQRGKCSGQAAARYKAQVMAALLKGLETVKKTGPHALRLICRDEEEKGTL